MEKNNFRSIEKVSYLTKKREKLLSLTQIQKNKMVTKGQIGEKTEEHKYLSYQMERKRAVSSHLNDHKNYKPPVSSIMLPKQHIFGPKIRLRSTSPIINRSAYYRDDT